MAVNTNVFRKLDEEYADKMEHLFGPELLGFPEDADSGRENMFTQNIKQFLTPLIPDVAHIQTGHERRAGLLSHGYKMMKGTWEVKAKIEKYPGKKLTPYLIVLYNKEANQYDVEEKRFAEKQTEKFGYIYNTDVMDKLRVGDTISNRPLYKSTSYDEHMNYRYGVNANVMFITDNSTIEDAVKIRRSFANRLQVPEVDVVEVSINNNDVLLNLYGDPKLSPDDPESYKAFADVGEHVKGSDLCATRRINLAHALYDFQDNMLREPTYVDTCHSAPKNGVVYDIDVFYNGDDEFPNTRFFNQLKWYYDRECEYADAVTKYCADIKASGASYTPQVSMIKAKYQRFTDKEYKWKNRDRVFGHIFVQFRVAAASPAEEGFKMAGRYGDKGVISDITQSGMSISESGIQPEVMHSLSTNVRSLLDGFDMPDEEKEFMTHNIQIVNDCDMPYLEDGTIADILLNSSGAVRRLNPGQLYEVEINFIGENLRKKIITLDSREEKLKIIFRFLEILNRDQRDFFYNLYQSFDQVVEVDGYQIELMDPNAQDAFIKSIEKNGFYIIKRPHSNMRYDTMVALYNEWPWIKPYTAYIDLFGIKKKQIMRPVVMGSKYMCILKQTTGKNFSARSTGRLDKKGLPAKSNDKKTNLSAYNTNPIKIGEVHNLFSSITGQDLAEYNLFMRSSPVARKSLDRILKTKGNPFDIKKLKIRDSYKNLNAVILQSYLKAIGIHLNFVTKDEADEYPDMIHNMRIDGFTVIDVGRKKPVYKKLLDLYMEYVESTIVIDLEDPNAKAKLAWDWVFEQEEVKEMDLMGITKDDMLNIVIHPETQEDLPMSNTEDIDDELDDIDSDEDEDE